MKTKQRILLRTEQKFQKNLKSLEVRGLRLLLLNDVKGLRELWTGLERGT